MDPATLENLIIREIRKAKEISRRDLAESLGIAKSTAGRRIDSMIERGLVRETGVEERREVGRPRRFLDLRGDYGTYAGFDFDARYLYAVLLDFALDPVEQSRIRLPSAPDRDSVLGLLRQTLAEFRARRPRRKILGVGVGVPGTVKRAEGVSVYYPYIADWRNVKLSEALGFDPKRLRIENNTRAVALGEYWLGPHTGTEHLLCLSVRTGISAAFVVNGEVVAGHNEMAGEIRAWPVGGRNWLEKAASVRSVIDGEPPGSDRWTDFTKACHEGARDALSTLAAAARHHGEAIARMITLLDPEAVFLSGPFTELGEIYLDQVRSAVDKALDGDLFAVPTIRSTTKGEHAGAYGAAALAAVDTRVV
jgi:N-acetylglucosamine repressor